MVYRGAIEKMASIEELKHRLEGVFKITDSQAEGDEKHFAPLNPLRATDLMQRWFPKSKSSRSSSATATEETY
jgi:hypothetical protein